MKQHKDCNFSYAGLKTQVRLAMESRKMYVNYYFTMFISISISCIYIYIDRHTHGYLFVIVKQGYYPCIYTLEHKVH